MLEQDFIYILLQQEQDQFHGDKMAHYAFLDENNLVLEVITGQDEWENGEDWEQHYAEFRGLACKRTSYNTHGGQHTNGGTAFRKNYAGPGYTYDPDLDAFIPPPPYASWTLDITTCLWQAPVPVPDTENRYSWDETNLSWKTVNT